MTTTDQLREAEQSRDAARAAFAAARRGSRAWRSAATDLTLRAAKARAEGR